MTFRLKDLPQKRLTEHMPLHLVTECSLYHSGTNPMTLWLKERLYVTGKCSRIPPLSFKPHIHPD